MVQDIEVLLVEDDLGDVELMKESLKLSKLYIKIIHVRDGQECMEYLRRAGKYENAQAPDLVLLDLNMPRKDGREVLSEMKADKFLKDIPVVVLTASHDVADVVKTYGTHYVSKPIDFYQFNEIVSEMPEFWFTIVKIPDGEGEKMNQPTRVLIIDDDATDQELIKESIKKVGFEAEIIVAFSGEEGIEKVNDLKPNVIIVLDTVLPGMNGFETCRKIKEIDKSFKIIICTGVVDAVDAAKARAFGADDYCVKTADFMALINAIKNFIVP